MEDQQLKEYWKIHLRYLLVLILIGVLMGFLLPIIWVEPLNAIQLGGYPLGIWFAVQGSIISFVILLFVYAWLMNRLDKRFDVQDDE